MIQQTDAKQVVAWLTEAEGLIKRDQADATLSFNKQFLDEVENLYKNLNSLKGLNAPETIVLNYQYVMRYFKETLFIAGRKLPV